jgi:glycosyltransferase involved in cell wall biosynthesis
LSDRADYPLVSIGVPVYNEARFLDASLASLRRQDYPNLEIVVADNASSDGTLAICERHAAEDPRIRIERSAVNRGALANFHRALELAQGTYFMWAAGHDLWTPNLVSECVALLQTNDGACIAFGCSRWIGIEGELLPRTSGWSDTRGMAPIARFFTIFWGNMHPVLGLMRAAQLRACPPMPNITGGDLVLLSDLALRGDFVHATQATWSRREFRSETRYEDKLQRYASTSTGIARSRLQRMFPLLQLPIALMRVVVRSSLPRIDKLAVLIALVAAFPLRYRVGRRKPAG